MLAAVVWSLANKLWFFFVVVVVPNALLIAWVKEQGQFKSLIPPGSLRALHEK